MKLPASTSRIPATIVICLALCSTCSTTAGIPATVTQGRVIGGHKDIHRGAPLSLAGEWDFRWRPLTNPGNTNHVMTTAPVPGTWNNLVHAGSNLPCTGVGTYSLRLEPGENNTPPGLLFTLRGPVRYRVRVNKREIHSNSKSHTGTDRLFSTLQPVAVFFQAPREKAVLIEFEIENRYDFPAGLRTPPRLGTAAAIVQERDQAIDFHIFLCVSLAVVALFHLSVFLFRGRRDTSHGYLGLTLLLTALHGGTGHYDILTRLFPALGPFTLLRLNHLAGISGVCGLLLMRSLFPQQAPRRTIRIILYLALAYIATVLCTPLNMAGSLRFLRTLELAFTPLILTMLIVITLILIKAARQGREDARIILAGFCLFFVTALHDLEILISGRHAEQSLIPIGMLIYLVFQSVAVTRNLAQALSNEEHLTSNLEQEVADRTAELEQERSLLHRKNSLLEEELELARRIQRRFIPETAPPSAAFYYRPMTQVGGDFLEFIDLGKKRTGYFVSDVSGHGVPAAFVTSMIKSFFREDREELQDPAACLLRLNHFLLEITAGNFVTAFYAIHDRKTRHVLCASAGHNPPFLISTSSVRLLDNLEKCLPLAVLDNRELIAFGKRYANTSFRLEQGERLLIYTDGLTEAIPADQDRSSATIPAAAENPTADRNSMSATRQAGFLPGTSPAAATVAPGDFETLGLLPALHAAREIGPQALVDLLVARLIEFRGSMEFEDDVCMVCVEG